MMGLQEQLAAKDTELSHLSAKHGELNNELRRVRLKHTAVTTVSDDLKLVAGACERPAKRARKTQLCEEFSTTPLAAVFLALLTKGHGFKNLCEALLLENQCFPGLAAEVKELREKLAAREKIYATAKTASKGREGIALMLLIQG